MAVPYTFGSATTSIPLSQLDSNFATAITLGNTAVQLGNTITTLTGVSNVASATSLSLGSNGNTTAVTIDTSQNVGIGGTNDLVGLAVQTPSYTTAYAADLGGNSSVAGYGSQLQVVSPSDSSTVSGISLFSRLTARSRWDILNVWSASYLGSLVFRYRSGASSTAEAMRIDSSGNLLIGRTTKQADIAGQTTNVQSSLGFSCYDGTQSAQITPTRIYFNGANGFYVLNASDTGVRLVNGATSWSAQSDERTKTALTPITDAVNKVLTLRTVTGRYLTDADTVSRSFLVAQDVKAVLPEAVDEDTDEAKTLGLRYTDVIPLLVAAIKELKTINDTQAETINALTARIVALESK
jgi:hypothetical protein